MDYKSIRASQRASAVKKYASGGAVDMDSVGEKFSAGGMSSKKSEKMPMKADEDGMKRGGRLDKKPRSKKDSVKINIINAPRSGASDPMSSLKAAPRPIAPMGAPSAASPLSMPAAMPSRVPTMRKCGGRMK